jgi:hypothetical protein
VLGLAPAAPSLERFEELLYEAQRTTPALDLVIEETQWRWEEHLANLGLDSALFRAHLIMNSQEGGATEIFKIKPPWNLSGSFWSSCGMGRQPTKSRRHSRWLIPAETI